MSDENEEPAKRSKRWVIAVVVLILYVLSTGLVDWIAKRHSDHLSDWMVTALRVIYAPVIWLAEVSPGFHETLNWYLGLFSN